MTIKQKLKKLHIKFPKIIGKVHYISELPTKKEFQKLILYKVGFFILFCLALYMMNDYLKDPFHNPLYKQMNDGRIINIEPNRLFIYAIVAVYVFVKFFLYSFRVYVVGDKGCIVYTFRFSKRYCIKQKLFSDVGFKFDKCLKEFEDKKFQETLTKMYRYFSTRR